MLPETTRCNSPSGRVRGAVSTAPHLSVQQSEAAAAFAGETAVVITEIDIFAFTPLIAARYATRAHEYKGLDLRTAYKLTTSSEVVGWGESRGTPPPAGAYDHLIGRQLLQALHDVPAVPFVPAQLPPPGNRNHDAGMECALYDAAGKHLKVPVHALLGRKLRDWVPVAAWTRPCSPVDFAADVQRAVDCGYMAMKMHTSPFYDVFEQVRAAEAVAPPGFRLHLDFNSRRSLAAVLPVVRALVRALFCSCSLCGTLQRDCADPQITSGCVTVCHYCAARTQEANHPIVAYIEDPLKSSDFEGYRTLRAQTTIPLIMQDVPAAHVEMLGMGLADIYMIGCMSGRYLVADALGFGWACASTNTPLVIQEMVRLRISV